MFTSFLCMLKLAAVLCQIDVGAIRVLIVILLLENCISSCFCFQSILIDRKKVPDENYLNQFSLKKIF